jgi:hypothetical protein
LNRGLPTNILGSGARWRWAIDAEVGSAAAQRLLSAPSQEVEASKASSIA